MKIGINRWTLPGDWDLAKCFREAAAAGFDGIEINVARQGYLTAQTSPEELSEIAALAAEAGIALPSISTGLGWELPMTSNDANVREQGREAVRSMLGIARALGAEAALCVPGVVSADVRYDVAYSRAVEALRTLAADAEAAGVVIGVENVWNKFLLSPMEFARLLDEVGSPWVRAYFDAGNVLVHGFPDHWIHILGGRIVRVHVKDFRTGIGNISGFCNPLQGDVPWFAVRDALRAVGYDGWITAEVDGYRTLPSVGLRHICESLRAVFC